jgi:histidinol phosphatase-like enzyme
MEEKIKKVTKEDMDKLPFIVAVDFDGTLVRDSFPNIGEKNDEVFRLVKHWANRGYKIVLWTCRDGQYLDDAVAFCSKHGLEFDAVNRNIPEVVKLFNNDTRKVYADVYVDDKFFPMNFLLGGKFSAPRIPDSE